ncbi:MAG TPA: bifunctional 4-hydroxy-2-oxoglutarate aldolase/2-dehydro-3-deoxy-phosphogluconate aldolase [Gemmatimonadaceae bacterium]|nr:bifunctional 4-hydroxy-2-oxoglutarate aldolase/2-dehydro-3-deoxy-phosphogluconate aldolase [Gemmatimonadaceae bacterium]
MNDVTQALAAIRIIPIIVIDDPANAIPLARALREGGISCVEITFRTSTAAEALRCITGEFPDLLVGAGTVLTPEQATWAKAAGAKFVVSPGFNPRVVDYCLTHDLPVYPGVCTPTEIETALSRGLRVVKFFPAEPIGGLAYLKAIAAPYRDIDFIPTGGVNASNLASYLAFKRVIACGGSWMAPAEWIAQQRFDRIKDESLVASAIARASRGATA